MRPGIVFILLFVGLVAVYLGLADTLGGPVTFALQVSIVLTVLGGARWLRRARSRGGWRLFADDDPAPRPEPEATGAGAHEEDRQIPRAS